MDFIVVGVRLEPNRVDRPAKRRDDNRVQRQTTLKCGKCRRAVRRIDDDAELEKDFLFGSEKVEIAGAVRDRIPRIEAHEQIFRIGGGPGSRAILTCAIAESAPSIWSLVRALPRWARTSASKAAS